jgi:pimeloyl-ACP methyl ester carboxylesterase
MKNILLNNEKRIPKSPDFGAKVGRVWNPQANSVVNSVNAGIGSPVILVHGLAASLHDWDALLPELSAHGYAGHAADLLGHGESAKPGSFDEYTSDTVFAHLSGWIDSLALDEPAILIGHSLGGYLWLCAPLPERVRARSWSTRSTPCHLPRPDFSCAAPS